MRAHTVVDSPVGPLTLVAKDGVLTGLYMDRQRYRPAEETFGEPDPEPFAEAAGQLRDYFAGHVRTSTCHWPCRARPSSGRCGRS